MILDKKGEIIRYIRNNKKVRPMELLKEFGYCGYTHSLIRTLKDDDIIEEKLFDCGHCKYWVIKK